VWPAARVGCRARPSRGTGKRKRTQEESMKVPEADRRASGEATEATAARRFVYGFTEDLGLEHVLALCGGKGSGLMRMCRLGLPVPEGFIITTEACASYIESGELPEGHFLA
jgi:hypothetical protein